MLKKYYNFDGVKILLKNTNILFIQKQGGFEDGNSYG